MDVFITDNSDDLESAQELVEAIKLDTDILESTDQPEEEISASSDGIAEAPKTEASGKPATDSTIDNSQIINEGLNTVFSSLENTVAGATASLTQADIFRLDDEEGLFMPLGALRIEEISEEILHSTPFKLIHENLTILDSSRQASITIDVRDVNKDPTAKQDDFTAKTNTIIKGNLLADNGNGVDLDIDGDKLSVITGKFATTGGGKIVIDTDGDFAYTGKTGFVGSDSVTYQLSDNNGGLDIGKVSFTITAAAKVPVKIASNINGSADSDGLSGTAKDDTIHGLAGDDKIAGGVGNDSIYGDDGSDTLIGDAGADTFFFEKATYASGVDTIADFNTKEGDIIDISDVLSLYTPGKEVLSDYVRFTDSGAGTVVAVDVNGTGKAFVDMITVSGGAGLDLNTLETDGNIIV